MRFQIYWRGWYRIIPWWSVLPADEYGPEEVYAGFSIFQFNWYRWRKA